MNRRITIITSDGVVGVDSIFYKVDLSALPTYFWAIQWYPDKGFGEIEYNEDGNGRKLPNTKFTDMAPYQQFVTLWDIARASHLEAIAAAEAAAADKAARQK